MLEDAWLRELHHRPFQVLRRFFYNTGLSLKIGRLSKMAHDFGLRAEDGHRSAFREKRHGS